MRKQRHWQQHEHATPLSLAARNQSTKMEHAHATSRTLSLRK
jgi:hypothetical protein